MDYSISQSIFDIIIYVLMLKGIYTVFFGKYNRPYCNNSQYWFYGICAFLISLFGGLDWDYYSYELLLHEFYSRGLTQHMEAIYFWIAGLTGNYSLWRAVVWGTATVFMMQSIKRFNCNYISTYVFITAIYILSFYKLRGSLGTSLFFLGFSYLYSNNKSLKAKDIIIGLSLVVFSFFFHKSMIVPLAIFIALRFIPLNKLTLIISLILYPFALSFVTSFLGSEKILTLTSNIAEINLALSSASSYAAEEAIESTLIGKIDNFFHYAPIYLSLLMIMYKTVIKNEVKFNVQLTHLLWFWYIITYLASLFFLQEVSFWIFIRLLTLGYFPMAIILGYYYRYNRVNALMRFIIISAVCSSLFSIFYQFISHFPNL